MNQSISVIICTRDRPAYLQECIASILQQSMRPKEIIVVDDASKERFDIEETIELAAEEVDGEEEQEEIKE